MRTRRTYKLLDEFIDALEILATVVHPEKSRTTLIEDALQGYYNLDLGVKAGHREKCGPKPKA